MLQTWYTSGQTPADPRSLAVRQLHENPTPEGFLGKKQPACKGQTRLAVTCGHCGHCQAVEFAKLPWATRAWERLPGSRGSRETWRAYKIRTASCVSNCPVKVHFATDEDFQRHKPCDPKLFSKTDQLIKLLPEHHQHESSKIVYEKDKTLNIVGVRLTAIALTCPDQVVSHASMQR